MNQWHAKWVEFIQTFQCMIKYKQGNENIVDDVLSWMHVLLSTLNVKLLGFEYVNDSDFANVVQACENLAFWKLYRLDMQRKLLFPRWT